MQQGRRTASLKASYEAINSGSAGFSRTTDISSINRELSGAAQTAIAAAQQSNKQRNRRFVFDPSLPYFLIVLLESDLDNYFTEEVDNHLKLPPKRQSLNRWLVRLRI